MSQLLDDLRAMDALFDAPEKWTQNAAARDASGNGVAYDDPGARCWCLSGARWLVCGSTSSPRTDAIIAALNTGGAPVIWNDRNGRAFAEVKALIAEAIRRETSR